EGSEGDFHLARIAARACSARCSLGAATPTNEPSRTTVTPAIASAGLRSTDTSEAPSVAGRSTLPKSIPGRLISGEYLCLPVTIARPSTLATEVPATFHCPGGVTVGE